MRTVMLFCLSVLSLASSIPASAEPLKSNSISITTLLEKARAASKIELWASDSVAEDKLSVYVDPSSTDKVEQGLDLLPGYQWISIKPADGTTYKVLGPDYIERSKWSSLADAADEEDQKRIAQYVKKRLAEYRAALALSKEELQSLAETDPRLVLGLTCSSDHTEIELLTGFNDEQIDQSFSPEGLNVNIRDLPADMQKKLLNNTARRGIEESAKKHAQQDGDNAPSVKELESMFVNTGTLRITNYDDMYGLTLCIESNDPFSGIETTGFVEPKFTYYPDYRALLLNAKGMSMEAAEDSLESERADFYRLYDEAIEKEKETRLTETPPRFGLRNATDIEIDKQLLSHPAEKRYHSTDLIQDICKQKGYSLFAFEPQVVWEVKVTGNTQLGYALDLAADSILDYVWAYQNEQIILVSRHFADRLAENIPLSTINKLRAVAAKTNGTFDLDGLAEVVSLLNQKQLDALPGNVPDDLENSGIAYAGARPEFIRLYASLSPRRREKACNGGISFTVLENKQRDLFYEALRSVVTAVDLLPKPSYFSVNDRGPQNSWNHPVTFTFGFVDGTTWPIDIRLPVPRAYSKTAQSAPKADDKPAPTQPQVLVVMNSLSEWNYIGQRTHDDDNEPKAVMYSQIGDRPVKRTLRTGDTLKDARLVDFGAASATFSLNGTQITFPITQAAALTPFDPKTPTEETSWIGVEAALEDALKKEMGE
ncbi:MAG: hypothetical protein ABFD64_06030 [Armatimonadota bacterium]